MAPNIKMIKIAASLYIPISTLSLFANMAKLVLLWRSKHKQKPSIFTSLLWSLAITNTISSLAYVIVGCFYVTISLKSFFVIQHLHVIEYVAAFAIWTSWFHVIGVSIDRLLSVFYPIKHRGFNVKRVSVLAVSSVWSVSFITLMLFIFLNKDNRRNFIKAWAWLIVAVGILVLITYWFIWKKATHRKQSLQHPTPAASDIRSRRLSLVSLYQYLQLQTMTSNEKALTINCIAGVLSLILCTFPTAIQLLTKKYSLWPLVAALLILKTLLDPVVYFYISYCRDLHKQRWKSTSEITEVSAVSRLNIPSRRYSRDQAELSVGQMSRRPSTSDTGQEQSGDTDLQSRRDSKSELTLHVEY